jgi:cell wall-associated NlpC family hydrolase
MPQQQRGISGVAVGAALLGAVFVYSGIKGYGLSAVIRNLIAGKTPANLNQTNAISGGAMGFTSPDEAQGIVGSGPNSNIASDGMQYVGVMYKFGGGNPSGWDCSGFVNYVLGHDLGYRIPGGIAHFTGSWHGPVAAQYYAWSGAETIPRGQASAGDLACWLTHIGIVVDSQHMVNAYQTGRPTSVTEIDSQGPPGEVLRIRRVKPQ